MCLWLAVLESWIEQQNLIWCLHLSGTSFYSFCFIYGTFKSITSRRSQGRYTLLCDMKTMSLIRREVHLWRNESFISIRLDWQLKIANDWKMPINKIDKRTPRNSVQYATNFFRNPVYEFLADAGFSERHCHA